MKSFGFVNVNDALPVLLEDLLKHGDEVGSRLGERTMELTHVAITLRKPWQRELALPGRKANVAAQIAETMWVLSGRNDITWLQHYLPRAGDFSDDGATWRAGYGPRLRAWGGRNFSNTHDQLAYIVELLQRSPGSRQAVATIWDPAIDSAPGKDIACNNWLHFLARRGKLDLMVGIRSNDVMWGWSGINAFEWSALLEIVAGMIGHEVGELHFAVGSFHLYDRHWAKARDLAGCEAPTWMEDSPRFNATGVDDMVAFDELCRQWFHLEAQIRTGQPITTEVDDFPEPMLQSWLRVLQWYWGGAQRYLMPIRGTRLAVACGAGVKPQDMPQGLLGDLPELAGVKPRAKRGQSFLDHVNALHVEKHAAYGDSWKRRGEYMILANIARKIDRLEGGAETSDETQVDTAIDLLVYLAKYKCWLEGLSGNPEDVEAVLAGLEPETLWADKYLPELLVNMFEGIDLATQKAQIVADMLPLAYALAHSRWQR